ncbi:hypothetical protein LWC34_44085 [Kibdelosporangium philippinense]|uniref:Uncharacterized protein n=1 Tax=Kibdelosporangium philippinense TaxID=211113 RepID=A0ABS8ZQ94_9PSEU|nr:hypothetical protein [Kibdelosporangium philippinense]MCE7009744.1 hypothetical protein [Kibdelosporangium philippinense]
MTDTPIYDQLRQELSSRRAVADSPPPKPRSRVERSQEPPAAPASSSTDETRQPVSVWTLVNANRRKR